jgi:hypothetical protein
MKSRVMYYNTLSYSTQGPTLTPPAAAVNLSYRGQINVETITGVGNFGLTIEQPGQPDQTIGTGPIDTTGQYTTDIFTNKTNKNYTFTLYINIPGTTSGDTIFLDYQIIYFGGLVGA